MDARISYGETAFLKLSSVKTMRFCSTKVNDRDYVGFAILFCWLDFF